MIWAGCKAWARVQYERNEPVFHAPWEGRAFALESRSRLPGASGAWTLSGTRSNSSRPTDYLRMSYYEKWLTAVTERLVESGLVTRAEVENGKPALARPRPLLPLPPPRCPRCSAAERSPVAT